MKKEQRQFLIKDIISKMEITAQDQLSRELRRRGLRVTQATLSRDLKELGVARIPSSRGLRYALPTEERKLKTIVGIEILSIAANETAVVIKTLPGRAHGVAAYLDSLHCDDILGTVAGDDTIIVAPTSIKRTAQLLESIEQLMTEVKAK
jgi:transcriptional regulator of arginine metabolism